MKKYLLIIISLLSITMCKIESNDKIEKTIIKNGITKYVNYNVINQEDNDVKLIIDTWQEYLESEKPISYNNVFWTSPSNQNCPSCIMRLIPIEDFKSKGIFQNTVIGVVPIKEDLWELTTMFSNENKGKVIPHFILKVYVKKISDEYKFMNKVDYLKDKLRKEKIDKITYYFNSAHKFDKSKAIKQSEFNKYLSDFFGTSEISFDYFICENSRSISKMRGYEFEPSMYVPNQTGAITDEVNKIIYVGNSSEYYPHEVVHIYTKQLFNYSYHEWIDEGIATMLGGSRGKELRWHMLELKEFLENNKDFELNDISKLNTVPNGKFTTEFRYVIGGLLVKEIYDKEGVNGVKNILQFGSADEDFYRLLKEKFGVSKEDFGDYIRKKMKEI